ncbi:MAG: DNA topoisomerase III [Verrucomicrobia bacterium]|nr:MAG: DNA topoisomerase III [Verrucomicrobiota bacterium]
MGKALIIAEKPSVAADIAKAVGGFTKDKTGEFFESDRYVLSSAVGHLLELAVPEEFEVGRGKWTFTQLPHLPPRFGLATIEKNQNRLKVLAKLIKRKDVDGLVNACDAGREGELIFRNIVEYTGAKQPIQRLWLQSMTPQAIRDGFGRLRSGADMQPLADASRCRSESDWLVGINGTRAMTAFNNKGGGFYLTTVGRVQTPTLAIVVEREERIRKFVARDYWEVIGTFAAQGGSYSGRWFDEAFRKPDGKDGDAELKAERLWDRVRAESIRARCEGKPGVVTEESKPATQMSPMLYDLTTLQREANGRFGFSAKNTLGLAQALYERHKVLTYPRTDSRHLPEDYLPTVRATLGSLVETSFGPFAKRIIEEGWVRPNKRVFNNAKVSDHFAIIPTGQVPKGLTEPEAKLFELVTRRFLAVFFPAAEFLETVRITRVEAEPFKSVGKVLVKAGWLEVYGRDAFEEGDAPALAPVQPSEVVQTTAIEAKGSQTKPPARFTEATLLGAMEGAGKMVEDDELREAMAERGLGTPATRASIIEGLISEEYLFRNGRELVPSAKAFSLSQLLRGLGVNELTRPELTGEWEFQLKKMERGQLSREQFMSEIRRFTDEIVAKAKLHDKDTIPGDFGILKTPCPKCGAEVHERYREFKCTACDFLVRKVLSGRMFEPAEIETLIRERQLGPLQGFRSRMGKPFAAMIKLTPENEARFDFGDGNGEGGEGEAAPDFTGREPVGKCPKCGSRVFENGMNYVCEKSVGPGKSCKFRTGTLILQQPVDRAQVTKLLAEGKTDLLKGFVSRKNNRKFEAFLVLKDGEVGFEFAPRERKAGAKAKDAKPVEKIDFTGKPVLARCPKCGGNVYEGPDAYLCEKSQAETRRCTFKVGKTILEQPVDAVQLAKLISTGRSDLLTKFVSKSGRDFQAHLVLGDKGKVEFEFPDR